MDQIIVVSCGNCGKDIKSRILNLTGDNEFHVEMMVDQESFDCNHCGSTTGFELIKEVF